MPVTYQFEPERSRYYTGNKKYPLRLPADRPAGAIADELLETRTDIANLRLDGRALFVYDPKGPLALPLKLP